MRKLLVTLASIIALLVTFSATAYADGDDELYKSKSDCWHDADLKTTASGGEDHYHCEYIEAHQDYGKGDCRPPRATSKDGCIGMFWVLKEDGGDGPHLPEEPSRSR
jgi:hypothetical protein